jgi:Gpi18-like mannosyltransferase
VTNEKTIIDSSDASQDSIKKHSGVTLLTAAVVSRIFVFSVALLSNWLFGVRCQSCWDIGFPLVNLFARWDSAYYGDLSIRGYSNSMERHWAFFPGYPIVMGAFGRILAVSLSIPLGLAVALSGFIISNLSFFGAVYYMYKLSKVVLHSANLAFSSALFLIFYPAGVFLSAVYSDSLFLMLTIGSLYFWRVKKLGISGILGFLAGSVRPVGVLLAMPFLYEILTTPKTRSQVASYLHPAVVLIPYPLFMVYSYVKTGSALAFVEAELRYWGIVEFRNPLMALYSLYDGIMENLLILPFVLLSVVAILASVATARKYHEESAFHVHAFSLLFVYLFIASLPSFPRFSITLIPVYWWVARWSSKSLEFRMFIYAVSLTLLAIGTGLFVNWYQFI